jgi:ribosomal protein S18 acetylase RimI-like enzyme
MDKIIKKCTLQDLESLRNISIETFYQTFADSNTAENMKAYLQSAYNEEKLYRELSNPNSSFFFVCVDERVAGYLKLNEFAAQTDINDSDSLELERIYILRDFQGMGLGKDLLEHAISVANEGGKKYIWLGVWEHNERAKRFYQKNGFYRIGEHSFVVGDDVQIDYVMRKDL